MDGAHSTQSDDVAGAKYRRRPLWQRPTTAPSLSVRPRVEKRRFEPDRDQGNVVIRQGLLVASKAVLCSR